MIDAEYALLSYVKENQPCSWHEVLNTVNSTREDADINTLNALLACCVSTHGWIEKASKTADPPLCHIRLTPPGETALLAESEIRRKTAAEKAQQEAKDQAAEAKRLRERAEDRADEERRHRTQNKIAIIMPFITFLLGMIAEHFAGIVGTLISLLH